jgi:hypothetical protein
MYNLLVFLFSLYPTSFIYNTIPSAYLEKLDSLAPAGFMFFVAHLIVFGIIFFVVYSVLKKFITIGFMTRSKTNFIGITLAVLMILAVVVIIFYTVLPGASVYAAPKLVDDYILSQPFTLILLLLPFGYLFFD